MKYNSVSVIITRDGWFKSLFFCPVDCVLYLCTRWSEACEFEFNVFETFLLSWAIARKIYVISPLTMMFYERLYIYIKRNTLISIFILFIWIMIERFSKVMYEIENMKLWHAYTLDKYSKWLKYIPTKWVCQLVPVQYFISAKGRCKCLSSGIYTKSHKIQVAFE